MIPPIGFEQAPSWQNGLSRRYLPASLILVATISVQGLGPSYLAADDNDGANESNPPKAVAKNAEQKWLDSLARGYTEAQRQQRPIFVKLGSATCRFCRELAVELEKPAIREELKRWTLVAIDVDKSPDDARLLAVGPIPALRALTSSGRVVAEEEGELKADALLKWFKDSFDEAASILPDDLDHEEPPDGAAVGRLIQAFRNRDAVIREAVVRKLLPHPDLAAAQVVEAFADGSLAVRLAALDLLVEWKAPAEGLDPWRKETLTEARLTALSEWGAAAHSAAADPQELDPADLTVAKQMIDHMLSGTAGEVQAIREQLARYGRLLLPEVYDRLKAAATDEARERLTILRYRLVESQTLALKWPGGIERLSASDPEIRLRAADELAARATAADESLLLELFSDPAPLVRELSLQALRQAGGSNVNSALLRLLRDPDPNVRAAVLKHLAEAPTPAAATRIVSYVQEEPDSDLVVHAVRVLREIPGNTTKAALMSLLEHESWRVRAEAAEALGKKIPRYGGGSAEEYVDIYMTMVELLKDQDGFVVSRAVETLGQADLVAAVDPLVAAAEAHPEMAVEVVKALAYGQNQRKKADVHLRRFADDADPRLRAAAIVGLTMQPGVGLADDVRKALNDKSADVRIAAANGFFGILENRRRTDDANVIMGLYRDAASIPESMDESPSTEDDPEVRSLPVGEPIPEPDDDAPVAAEEAAVPEGQAPNKREAAPASPPAKSFFGTLKTIIKAVTGDSEIPAVEDSPVAPQAERQPDESSFAGRDRAEEWLRVVRSGKIIPKSQRGLRESLLPLLAAEDPQERIAGILPLVALGADEQVIAEMLRLIEADARFVARLAEGLPWLLAAERETVLEKMLARPATRDDLALIASNLAEIRSPQAEQALWQLVTHAEADLTTAETVKSSLVQFYFPRHSYQLEQAPARDKKRAIAAATAHAKMGPHRQRLVALAMLVSLEPTTVLEIARPMFDDQAAPLDERTHALQFVFLTLPEADAVPLAVAQFTSTHVSFQEKALAVLVGDDDALRTLSDGVFHLNANSWYQSHAAMSMAGQPIAPEPPTGLAPEPLLPLLNSDDSRIAAHSGYLLALLERNEGLPRLLAHWRTKAPNDTNWMRLVYRAITSLNDGTQVPVLREIYSRLHTDDHSQYLGEFYWTIRSMTAQDVLPLRKTIRDEVGLQNLR
jgi:HEAT repeat protein